LGVISKFALADWEMEYTMRRNAILMQKGVGMKDQSSTYLEMSFTGFININVKISSKVKERKKLELRIATLV